MKFRSLMTAICVMATANMVSAAPFAYVANSGTKNVSVIDTAITPTGDGSNAITATVSLPDTNPSIHPYAYGVAVSASGQYVYVGLQDTNEVAVIDAARNTVVKRIGLGTDSPGGLAVNAAETRLYVASNKSNTLLVIDITGSSAIEVARVTVDDSSVSTPEGVVLSKDEKTVFVANSTKGTVAEISVDETNNIYSRTNLISLGNNAQPMGLTINSTGTKLYAASLNGHASVVDISSPSRTVTDLPLTSGTDFATGNVSVAITPDDSKIFAPSNSLDKFYVIDGVANTVSGTTYAAVGGPMGSSVTPVGNKLFLTMNTISAGNTVQLFDTTNLSAAPAVITLPLGAKPTSMGDFIGPVLQYTIDAAAQTNCNISPSGAVLVNNLGRTFSVVAGSGACKVWTGTTACTPSVTGGTFQGYPSTYTFSNVTANTTICAENIAGTFFTLSGDWNTTVAGAYLVSNPVGISLQSKSAKFVSTDTVTLQVGDSSKYIVLPGSWTGDCAGSTTSCTLAMTANRTFGATLIPKPSGTGPIYDGSNYYQTLDTATTGAANGAIIKISTSYTTGGTTAGTAGNIVTLSGGWDTGFSSQTVPCPVSVGALTITNVGVIADNLVI